MIDPLGTILAELRTAGIASGRVRGGEAATGDLKQPGSYQRVVILSILGRARLHRAPVQTVRLGVRAYAPTYQDAAALYGEISDLLDNAGMRVSASDIPIYQSLDEGDAADTDPLTGQPYMNGVVEVIAGTQALAGS